MQRILTPDACTHDFRSFYDNFDRADGLPANGSIGDEWVIVDKHLKYAPVLGAEKLINPGAEGTYTAGLAPNWTVVVGSGTKAEELTIIHGGAKSEHLAGAGREFLAALGAGTLKDKNYFARGWIYKVSGTALLTAKSHTGGGITSAAAPAASGEGWQQYGVIFRNPASGVDLVDVGVDANTGECYVDDLGLVECASSRFSLRRARKDKVIVCASLVYACNLQACGSPGKVFPGAVLSADNPLCPLNYVALFYDGTELMFRKILNGVYQTTPYIHAAREAPFYQVLEIQKNGTTYSCFVDGVAFGTPTTITDAAIVSNEYAGVMSNEACPEAKFANISIRPYGSSRQNFETRLAAVSQDGHHYAGEHYSPTKGLLSMRFDDGDAKDLSEVLPRLTDRGLHAGFAIIRDLMNSNRVSQTQALALQAAGHEIMCHTHSHSYEPTNYRQFAYETAVACEEMRKMGLWIDAWVQSGGWYGVNNHYNLTTEDFYGTPEDLLLRQYFGWYAAYIVEWDYTYPMCAYQLPIANAWGLRDINIASSDLTYSENLVTNLCNTHRAGICNFHSGDFGLAGFLSWADFTTWLDFVAAKVAADQLIVLTPSQQVFATSS